MPTEMQSTSESTQSDKAVSELDPEALAAIRSLLETQPKARAGSVPEHEEPPTAHPRRPVPQQSAARAREDFRQPDRAEPSQPERQPKRAGRGMKTEGGQLGRLKSALHGYRPTPRHIVLAALCLMVLFRPWLVLGIIFLSLFGITVVFLILGYDGFWHRAMGLARWYARRRPSRASELHRKLDAFAMRWDAILDRFPEGSVDGLYLPDFGELASADLRHDEALDRRFANMRQREG